MLITFYILLKQFHSCLSILFTLLINITSDLKALCMIGKPWRKMDFHGGYAAYDGHRICMMNSGQTTLEDLLAFGLFLLVSTLDYILVHVYVTLMFCIIAQKQELRWLEDGRSYFCNLELIITFLQLSHYPLQLLFCDSRWDLENPYLMPSPEQLGRSI